MSMNGIDYYGADVGGYHREYCGTGCDFTDLYTQWFEPRLEGIFDSNRLANAAWFDVPVRPHAVFDKEVRFNILQVGFSSQLPNGSQPGWKSPIQPFQLETKIRIDTLLLLPGPQGLFVW